MKKIVYFACLLFPFAAMSQTTTTTQQTTTSPGGATINMSIGGMPATTVQQTTITTTTTTTSTDAGAQTQAQSTAPAPVGCVPMSQGDYESAKGSISGKDFEDTKLSMAKTITGSNNLTAEQIRGIMKLFSFENSKLDFAKFAYSHCCDKSNYYKVDDAFEFDSSTTELNSYISSH